MKVNSKNPKGSGRKGKFEGLESEPVSFRLPVKQKELLKSKILSIIDQHIQGSAVESEKEPILHQLRLGYKDYRKLLIQHRLIVRKVNAAEREKREVEQKISEKLNECYEATVRLTDIL